MNNAPWTRIAVFAVSVTVLASSIVVLPSAAPAEALPSAGDANSLAVAEAVTPADQVKIVFDGSTFVPEVVRLEPGTPLLFVNDGPGILAIEEQTGQFTLSPIPSGGGAAITLAEIGSFAYSDVYSGATGHLVFGITSFLGAPGTDLVLDHIPDAWAPFEAEDSFSIDPTEAIEYSRSRMKVAFVAGTTVGEAEAALARAGVVIIGGNPTAELLTVAVPATSDHSSARAAVTQLQSEAAVDTVVRVVPSAIATLPSPVSNPTGTVWEGSPLLGVGPNSGQQAAGFPQLWNLTETLRRKDATRDAAGQSGVTVAVWDAGFDPAHPDLGSLNFTSVCNQTLESLLTSGSTPLTCTRQTPIGPVDPGNISHGNNVSGIIGAHPSEDPAWAGQGYTGGNPTATMVGIQMGGIPWDDLLARILDLKAQGDPRFKGLRLINVSMSNRLPKPQVWAAKNPSFTCGPGPNDDLPGATSACLPWTRDDRFRAIQQVGQQMVPILRRAAAAGVVVVVAATNAANDYLVCNGALIDAKSAATCSTTAGQFTRAQIGIPSARFGSDFTAANQVWVSTPKPNNLGPNPVIVVEALSRSHATPTTLRSWFSMVQGTYSAQGYHMGPRWTFPDGKGLWGPSQGTSQATPTVTAVLSSMLALNPDMSPQILRSKVRTLSDAADPDWLFSVSPRIDAFGSMLAVDGALLDLLDVSDPSLDGNRRVVLSSSGAIGRLDTTSSTESGFLTEPDGVVDLRDFRRFRDAWLQVCDETDPSLPECNQAVSVGISLDGSFEHPKNDLNFDGCVNVGPSSTSCPTSESVFPRFDFNGDGQVSLWDLHTVNLGPAPQELTDLDVFATKFQPETEGFGWWAADPVAIATMLEDLMISGDITMDVGGLLGAGATNLTVTLHDEFKDKFKRPVGPDEATVVVTVPAGRPVDLVIAGTRDGAAFEYTQEFILGAGEDVAYAPCGVIHLSSDESSITFKSSTALHASLLPCDNVDLSGVDVALSVRRSNGSGDATVDPPPLTDSDGVTLSTFNAGLTPGAYIVSAQADLPNSDGTTTTVNTELLIDVTEGYLLRTLDVRDAGLLGQNPSLNDAGTVVYTSRTELGGPRNQLNRWNGDVPVEIGATVRSSTDPAVDFGNRVELTNDDFALVSGYVAPGDVSTFKEWALQVRALYPTAIDTMLTSTVFSPIGSPGLPTGNGVGGRVLPVQRETEVTTRVAQYSAGQLALGPELGADWVRHADNGYTVGRADLWPVTTSTGGTEYTSAMVVGDANLGAGAGLGEDTAFVTPLAVQATTTTETPATWSLLGDRPDISPSGDVVAFIGERSSGSGTGPGTDPSVYVAVRSNDRGSFYEPVAITGPSRLGPPELGTAGTDPVYLIMDTAAGEHDLGVGVVHALAGVDGLADDIVTVAVFGRPSNEAPGSGGLYTITLRLGANGQVTLGPAEPVVLLGDTGFGTVSPDPVSAIGWHRVIADGGSSASPGEHRLAFWVQTGATERIVQAQWVGAPSLSASTSSNSLKTVETASSETSSSTSEKVSFSRTARPPARSVRSATQFAFQTPPPPQEVPAVVVSDITPEDGDLITVTNRSPLRVEYGGWLTFEIDGTTRSLARGESTLVRVDISQSLLAFTGGGIVTYVPLDIQPPAGVAPVSDAGGPYSIDSGAPLALDASASTDSDGTIVTYEWDLDGDGVFDDADGVMPEVAWALVAEVFCGGPCAASTWGRIQVRVTDDDGLTSTAEVSVTINVVVQDFHLTIQPSSEFVNPGGNTDLRVDVGSVGGFIGDVDLEIISAIPVGYRVSLSSTRVEAPGSTSIQVLAPPESDDPEPITFDIQVRGTSGATVHETSAETSLVLGLIPICYETVTGIVMDQGTREPLPGVDVTLTYGGRVTTDVDGRYSFPAVAEGTLLRLRADTDGYFLKDVFEYSTCGGPNEIDIELVAERSVIVRGSVVEGIADPTDTSTTRSIAPTSTPVAEALVFVFGAATANSAADGAYSADAFLKSPDNRSFGGSVRAQAPGFWNRGITGFIVEDGPAIEIDVPMVRACTTMVGARGRVIDQNGVPVPDRTVQLIGSSGPRPGYSGPAPTRLGSVVSDADGFYDIPPAETYLNTQNARYPFRVEDARYTSVAAGFEYGECGAEHVEDIDLVVNTGTPPEIVYNYGAITGRIIDAETGEPVANTRVAGRGLSDADGYFTVSDIYIGQNEYTVRSDIPAHTSGPVGYYQAEYGPFVIEADETTDVGDLEIIPIHYYSLEGYIFDQLTGEPVVGATVSLDGWSASPANRGTDEFGFYRWDKITPAGTNEPVTATLSAVKTPAYPWSPPETYFLETTMVDLVPGQLVQRDMELLERCDDVTVRGIVVNAVTGEPLEGVSVKIGWHSDGTDADGFFLFEGLGAGAYNTPGSFTLVASKSGFITLRKTISVFCGATITVNFGVETGSGAVFGTVIDDQGDPIEGAFVGSGSGDSANTAADGAYRMDEVPLDLDGGSTTWGFTAIHPDGRRLEATADVTNGGETELNFVFPTVGDPPNAPPVADDLAATVAAGGSVDITLSGSDADGDSLTFEVPVPPSGLDLTGMPTATYTAPPDGDGTVTFEYVADDGTDQSQPATVTITIERTPPSNAPPTADDLTATVAAGGSVDITLSGDDVDGDPLTFVVTTPPSSGSLAGTPPTVTYTAPADGDGPLTFEYVADDGTDQSQPSTVTITIEPAGTSPEIEVATTADPISVPETGGPVDYTFTVSNIGPTTVEISSLSDDQLGTLDGNAGCQVGTELAPGASCTFEILDVTVSGDFPGIHDNVFTGQATDAADTMTEDSGGASVQFDDVLPDISVGKTVDHTEVFAPGEDVGFEIVVTNNSLEDVTIDSLTDTDFDLATRCPGAVGTKLARDESYTCTFTELITAAHENGVTVEASDDDGNQDIEPATATVGVINPSIDIEVSVNGSDADVAPGPEILVGAPLTWTYVVTNDGDVDATDINVTDSDLGSICTISLLAVGSSASCTATGASAAGQHANTGTAGFTHTDGDGDVATRSDSDDTYYFGADPSIAVDKQTADDHGNEGDGPAILAGDNVTWNYYVANTGNVPLENVTVTDDQGVTVSCPQSGLAVDESMTCTAAGVAVHGLYENTGSAFGDYSDDVGNDATTDGSDTSSYYGLSAGTVTDSSLCDFGDQFRLILTPDMQRFSSSTPFYKLSDSNPGQFFYNVFHINDGSYDTVTLEIPYPFVTQGANPAHVYGGVVVDEFGCLDPTDEGVAHDTAFGLSDYEDTNGDDTIGFGDVYLVDVPVENGFQYVNLHLDYGLEKTKDWEKKGANVINDGLSDPLRAGITIDDDTAHTFNFYTGGTLVLDGIDTIRNLNEFKQVRGFGGLVFYDVGDGKFEPLPGAQVQLIDEEGSVIETMGTDEDGWYLSDYVHKGKAAEYELRLVGNADDSDGLTYSQQEVANVSVGGKHKFGEGDFWVLPDPPLDVIDPGSSGDS